MKEETKQAVRCLAGFHKWIDDSNNYAVMKKCEHCGKTKFIRLKMTGEN